jgi:hypothetical protein
MSPTLVPLPLAYVPDAQLKEGRQIIPLALDFSKNNVEDISGTFFRSTVTVQTANVRGTTILSAIKSVCVKYNTFQNQILTLRCQETNQEWVIGVPATVPPGNENFVVNARLPMFLPQSATLIFVNYSLVSDPPTTNSATVQLCNFEVQYALEVVANPFGVNL